MQINLDLAYRLKPGEEFQFLEPFEVEEVNAKIRCMAALATVESRGDAIPPANEIRAEYIAGLGSVAPRVSAYLLRMAVELRYRKDTQARPRIEVPRKGPAKTKPGVWWGDLQVQLEDYPAAIDVPVAVAQWHVATWDDDKVQNGLGPVVKTWANIFDAEIERLKAALEAKATPGPASLSE